MKKLIFLMNIISVVFSVFIASPFVVSGIVLSVWWPNYPYEAFYIDFFLLFLHIFYIIFLVVWVLYSINYVKKSIKKSFIFALIPYLYMIILFLIYSYNG